MSNTPNAYVRESLNSFFCSVQLKALRQAEFAVKNRDEALDIVQDAMEKLARKYSGKPQEWGPLFQRILQNAIRDWYRKQKIQYRAAAEDEDVEEAASGDAGLPENELQRAQLVQALEAAMQELPPEQLDVFLLHQERGFTVAEIAEIVGLDKEAAKSRYRYAVRKLRHALEVVK